MHLHLVLPANKILRLTDFSVIILQAIFQSAKNGGVSIAMEVAHVSVHSEAHSPLCVTTRVAPFSMSSCVGSSWTSCRLRNYSTSARAAELNPEGNRRHLQKQSS